MESNPGQCDKKVGVSKVRQTVANIQEIMFKRTLQRQEW